jgi:RNA-binding protein 5/10
MRKFNTIGDLNKHERLSSMHTTNLKNEPAKMKALALVRKFAPRLSMEGRSTVADNSPAYRDRAAERRQAFGQSKNDAKRKPMWKTNSSSRKSPSPVEEPVVASKGASLLGKMGYVEGKGLGAAGEGRTGPLPTSMYAAGVGLGAQGGKIGDAAEEANRNTKSSYAEYVERTKDKAKERYMNM